MKSLKIPFLAVFSLLSVITYAQEFDIDLQLRPRFEFRNGYKAPIPYGVKSSEFISQRSRISFDYKQEQFETKLTLQNIRVWGDVSTNALSDVNGIEVYEAWFQYNFNEKWKSKIGRQIISYDNQRIFGVIDWAQQAQSFDAVLVSYKKDKSQLDLGFALNSGGESNIETPYIVPTFKNLQYAWFHTQFSKLNASFLALNTGYESLVTEIPLDLRVDYMQTFGTYLNTKGEKWDANFWAYGQTGKSKGNSVSAYDLGINVNYSVSQKFKVGIGYEFLSGKSQDDSSNIIKSFNPIFGTNHGFNGYMDYFYVGNYKNTVGLQDAFVKLSYNVNKWQFALIPHLFYAANTILDRNKAKMDSYYGTEVDFTLGYKLNNYIAATGGYSQMFGTASLQQIKGGDVDHTNNWAWIMINVDPKIFSFKKQ